ncbi:MAG: TonB-dependent receptor plug domain-containing protein, partial [Flavitalea sp.]
MRRILPILCGLLLLAGQVWAQTRQISGKVADASGNPVPNASVFIKGTNSGTTTNMDGQFSLTVPNNARALIISSVGQKRQEVSIVGRNSIEVSMESDNQSLDEVVITGYQAQRKREVTTAIARVGGEEIRNLPLQSFDRAIQGRAAGVDIRSNNGIPGGAVNVRIRGVGSITAGNDPLYIVDGVQINSSTVSFGQTFTQTNPLAYLNPNDIESIEILKDAAAASIYGARAGNGVILITTKKGKAGKTSITVNSYYGITQPLKQLDVLSTRDYINSRAEAYQNTLNLPDINTPSAALGAVGGVTLTPKTRTFSDMGLSTTLDDKGIDTLPNTNWQDAAFREGQVKNIDISISG